MPSVVAYHRPETLDEAAALLSEPGRRVLGGGTVVVPDARVARAVGVELVDLQGLDLGGIEAVAGNASRLRLGAMCRVGELIEDPAVPELLRSLARRELPSTLRYQATIGGTVVLGAMDSVLVAGLLVHDATVDCHNGGPHPLASFLADEAGSRIVTGITIDATGAGALAVTGRTPADDPIVAAVARRAPDGTTRLALTGVAPHPIEVDPGDPTAGLDPPTDFRGSADYRRHLAAVLSARALAGIASDAEGERP